MKILMIPTFFGGISRWRFETPAVALREAGHEVKCLGSNEMSLINKKPGDFKAWLWNAAPHYDLIHAGYCGFVDFAKSLLEVRDFSKVPLVVDIDDDLRNVPAYNAGWMQFRPGGHGHRVATLLMQHADAVTVSTKPLAEHLAYLNPNMTVLENWIDPNTWDHPTPPERAQDQSVRLMLTGGRSRHADWELIKDPLINAMNKYDGTAGKPMLRLFFLGATPDWILPWMMDKRNPLGNRVFYLHPTMSVTQFNQMVRRVAPDIMVSPTIVNTFNKAKSGLKFLEAALAGAAFACTDFETYSVAPPGTCIKLDNTTTQWAEALANLIEDKDLRERLADKAKEWVLANGDIRTHICHREAFYQKVIEEAKRAGAAQLVEREPSPEPQPIP